MSREEITRRDLLRGRTSRSRPEATRPEGHTGPIVKPGQKLPDVISWLDPEMRATPRRGAEPAALAALRPPGAIAEGEFLEACTRCGDCATACPPNAIRSAPARFREAEGTPLVDPLASPCLMCDGFPCIAACETGALRDEAPAALGTASVSPLDCLNRMATPCSVCIERCPVPGAIDFVGDVPEVNAGLCTGCGVCQHVCPAPQNAILILPNAERPTALALDLKKRDEEGLDIELPDLHEGELDDAGLRALFRDLVEVAQIEEIRCKQRAAGHADDKPVRAHDALVGLLAGHVRGAQIRYRFDGQHWCDTVLATPSGYRVVRLASPQTPRDVDR